MNFRNFFKIVDVEERKFVKSLKMTYYVLSQLFYSIIYVLFKSTFVVALYFFLKHLIRAFDIVASSFQYLSYKLIAKQIVKYDHQRK